MLAQGEGLQCVLVMKIGCTADYDCLNAVDREQFAGRGAGDWDAKVVGNLLRLLSVSFLDGNKFGVWVPKQSWNVCERCPPSRPNNSAFNFVVHRVLL